MKAAPPAVAELGLKLVIAGAGGLIVKPTALEADPPGLVTLTLALPAAAIRLAATDAVSCVALTNVVGMAVPFHLTVEPDKKPVPFTVRVKAAPPAVAEVGLTPVMPGPATLNDCVTVIAGA
jgi:hypothetical protein